MSLVALQHALDLVEPQHEMEFHSAATGYVITYRCRSCGRYEQFDCGWIESIPSYDEARSSHVLVGEGVL